MVEEEKMNNQTNHNLLSNANHVPAKLSVKRALSFEPELVPMKKVKTYSENNVGAKKSKPIQNEYEMIEPEIILEVGSETYFEHLDLIKANQSNDFGEIQITKVNQIRDELIISKLAKKALASCELNSISSKTFDVSEAVSKMTDCDQKPLGHVEEAKENLKKIVNLPSEKTVCKRDQQNARLRIQLGPNALIHRDLHELYTACSNVNMPVKLFPRRAIEMGNPNVSESIDRSTDDSVDVYQMPRFDFGPSLLQYGRLFQLVKVEKNANFKLLWVRILEDLYLSLVDYCSYDPTKSFLKSLTCLVCQHYIGLHDKTSCFGNVSQNQSLNYSSSFTL